MHHVLPELMQRRGHERERSRTAAAGFDHHLVKPADIGALHAVLAAALH